MENGESVIRAPNNVRIQASLMQLEELNRAQNGCTVYFEQKGRFANILAVKQPPGKLHKNDRVGILKLSYERVNVCGQL